jgi:FtsH-binding integral membrane protein
MLLSLIGTAKGPQRHVGPKNRPNAARTPSFAHNTLKNRELFDNIKNTDSKRTYYVATIGLCICISGAALVAIFGANMFTLGWIAIGIGLILGPFFDLYNNRQKLVLPHNTEIAVHSRPSRRLFRLPWRTTTGVALTITGIVTTLISLCGVLIAVGELLQVVRVHASAVSEFVATLVYLIAVLASVALVCYGWRVARLSDGLGWLRYLSWWKVGPQSTLHRADQSRTEQVRHHDRSQ